jgi:hypothetical protein
MDIVHRNNRIYVLLRNAGLQVTELFQNISALQLHVTSIATERVAVTSLRAR